MDIFEDRIRKSPRGRGEWDDVVPLGGMDRRSRAFLGGLVGGALSGLAGLFGARSGNAAGFNAMNLYDQKTRQGLLQQGYMLYGPGFEDFLRAALPGEVLVDTQQLRDLNLPVKPNPEWYDNGEQDEKYQRDLQEYEAKQRAIQGSLNLIGGKPIYEQQQDIINQTIGDAASSLYGSGRGGGAGGLRGNLNRAIRGQKQDIRNVRAGYENLIGGINDLFGQARFGVGNQFRKAEGEARQWAKGREEQIRQDSAEALKNQNQVTHAAMAGLGANTLVGNQLQQNAQQNQRETNRALTDVGATRSSMVQGTQKAWGDMLRSLYGQQAGLVGGLGQSRLGATERMKAALRAMQTQKAGAMYGAEQDFFNRRAALMGQPLGLSMGFAQSPYANPWYGQNTTQYFPGFSESGSFLAGFGGGFGAGGGFDFLNSLVTNPGGGG